MVLIITKLPIFFQILFTTRNLFERSRMSTRLARVFLFQINFSIRKRINPPPPGHQTLDRITARKAVAAVHL